MSSRIDIKSLAVHESEQVACKENVADVNDVVRTLSAFANDLANLGGTLVSWAGKGAAVRTPPSLVASEFAVPKSSERIRRVPSVSGHGGALGGLGFGTGLERRFQTRAEACHG